MQDAGRGENFFASCIFSVIVVSCFAELIRVMDRGPQENTKEGE